MTLLQSGVFAGSGIIRMRVAAALSNAARDIENEAPETANHAARAARARPHRARTTLLPHSAL
jgi:hypothetical protein